MYGSRLHSNHHNVDHQTSHWNGDNQYQYMQDVHGNGYQYDDAEPCSPLRAVRDRHHATMNSDAPAIEKVVAAADYYFSVGARGLEKAVMLLKDSSDMATPHLHTILTKLNLPSSEELSTKLTAMGVPQDVQKLMLCKEANNFHKSERENEIVEPIVYHHGSGQDEEIVDRLHKQQSGSGYGDSRRRGGAQLAPTQDNSQYYYH